MYFLGIDPGANGAVCVLDPLNPTPTFVSLSPKLMFFEVQQAIWDEVQDATVHATLEEVHSLYGMSAKSNFTFGGMFWRAKSLLESMQYPYELVQPKAWQQAVGAPTRKFLGKEMDLKHAIADLAQGYYPTAQLHGPKGGLMDGRSDALMIAHYAYITHRKDYGL